MTPERWRQIEEVFQAALDLPAHERTPYIAASCAGDEELHAQVAALVAQHEAAGEFIERPAVAAITGLDPLPATVQPTAPTTGAFIDPAIGRRVGAYQLVREIGRGGMGAVYLAERADGEFRQRVAIKLIKRGMDTDFILRRFRHERQILATLDHPFIARLLDGGTTTDGLPFFVMEHIEGLPVYRYCDERKLPIAERLQLFAQICDAVHYAHRNLVIHRDIKPSNILVTADGVPKLLDFGIAKMLNPDFYGDITHDPTATAMRLMTPEYASPEQAQGLAVTQTTDVYSLGVLMYELLTGHRPYRLRNRAPHEVARIICEEEPVPLSAVITRPDDLLPTYPLNEETTTLNYLYWSRRATVESLRRELSGDLENIVMKALRKEPAQRYQTVEHLREDIMRYLEGRAVSAPPYIPSLLKSTQPHERAQTDELSVAVLPFRLLDAPAAGETGDEYLGVGLADALITRLSHVRRLVVRPTTSVLQYGELDELVVVGQRLGVHYLVVGSIDRTGDSLGVGVQLFSVGETEPRWSGQFKQKLTDVLQLEDLISEQIAGMLVPQLTGEEREQLAKRGTDNAEAYEAYLRGRYHFHSLTEEGFAKALVDYHRAIALDPDYALAYAGIADYYIFLGIYGIMPFAESSAAAKEAAQRAVALDDTLAEAYAALGFATVCRDFDWQTAEEHQRRAIELNPNSATAHNWYGFLLLQTARFEEARREIERALALDPMSPLGMMSLAWCHYHARRFDDALAAYRKVIEAEPRFAYGRLVYSWALRCAGRNEEAILQAAKAVEIAGDGQLYLTGLGAAYAAAGRTDDARSLLTLLRELARTRYVSPYCRALIYCSLGDKDQALALLEEAVAIGDAWVSWLVVDPQLDVLRGDARLGELAERTNNPAASLATTHATDDKAIAILPLKVLTPRTEDTSDDYLGLALADALSTRLSSVPQLVVRPTNSVARYQDTSVDPLEAGRELQVNYIVSGNIRRVGQKLRVSVQLLSVAEGATRWAGMFDESASDVLQLEASLAPQLASALMPHLTGHEERPQLSKRGTDNPEAYEAYLRGRYYWTSMSATGFDKALTCYQRAVELDPAYAAAYAGIAEYNCWQAIYGMQPPADCLAAARVAARRAVELDDSCAEAHAARGLALLTHETQWQAAGAEFQRALELNPNYASARSNYACQLAMEGRFDEAIVEARRARAIDPLNPFNAYLFAWCLYEARRYEENIAEARRLIQSEPNFGSTYLTLSWALRQTGAYTEAVAAAEHALELIGRLPMLRATLAAALAAAGRTEEARAISAELRTEAREHFVTPYHRALVHLQLGEQAEALTLLEESVNACDPWTVWLGVEPQLDPLRAEPRFVALLERTHHPFSVKPETKHAAQPAASPSAQPARQAQDSGALHAATVQGARYTEDEEAHQLYVAGRYYATRRTAEGLRQAIERLERATQRAPQFALAFAELADCYALLNWYVEPPPAEAWTRAQRAALSAVEADDKLAEAHASLGFVKLHYERDWAGAEREFRRALELKPENPAAHRWYAFSLAAAGRHTEAIAEIRRAQEILPQSPVMATAVANVLFLARRFDEAIAQCRRALELDPGSVAANVVLRWAYEAKGLHADALAAFEQERSFAGDTPTTRAKHAHVLAACGRRDEARALLDDLLAHRDEQWVTAYELAVIFSLLNDHDNAFHWLAQAEREHAVGFTFLRVDPHLDNLRADPRFDALLKRMDGAAG